MADSFPNAENAFRDAFNHPDPTPKLLELIKAHPQLPTITDLVSVYMGLVAVCPTQIDKFAGALVKLQSSTETTVAATDDFGNRAQRQIAPVLIRELAGFHGGNLAVVEDHSAGAVAHGLHFKDRCYRDAPASREVLVLGACLQLLVCGSYLYGPAGTDVGKDDVLAALEVIKEEGIVENTNGQRLLEVTIRQAKSGFKSDVDDAWRILFPQEA
ncbi:hypothetical protein BDZ97DRAFT_1756386 [Flammula alnicola]|nr:hypothetical protein BDZ97DRAFT_1756386 [Flammula alnicola]